MAENLVSRFYLLVERGPNVGARLIVDATPKTVGRGREAHLVLADPCVSRRHLEAVASPSGVVVTLCSGANPFVIEGQACASAEVKPNGQILVGDTVLRVVVAPMASAEGRAFGNMGSTHIHTLLSGAAMDVRGLAAIFALVELLDGAADIETLEGKIGEWAKMHADAVSATLGVSATNQGQGTSQEQRSEHLVVEANPQDGRAKVIVPLHCIVQGSLTVELEIAPARVTDSLRRLLVVAGRVCGSRIAQLQAMRAIQEDRDSLRRLAVGSARAFLGSSPAAEKIAQMLPKLASSDATVLLTGETGSGKTFVARLIHEASERAAEPLRVINCAAIPENLIESELFGHERGAFTGAVLSKAGAFESAGRGTLLLDEIGEMPLASQTKLLRVLEDKLFERVGSTKSIALTARVLVATNRDLESMVKEGVFRSDLYFRVSVLKVTIPPLRERIDDIPELAERILADLASSAGRRIRGFSPSAMDALKQYAWPGNVRELRNVIESSLALGDGPMIERADMPEPLRVKPQVATPSEQSFTIQIPAPLSLVEKQTIDAALRVTGGNRSRAAEILGISRVTLYNKLR